jgi:CheY-like chemotaxis protein
MRILYVEDNEANQALVGRVVRAYHHSIVFRDEGEGALELLAADSDIDLILLDIELAGAISGLDVVTALRARNDHRPIVAVTAYAMMGDRERILAAGCDQYLPKPLVITDLLALMEHYQAGDMPLAHLETSAAPAEPASTPEVPVPEAAPETPAAAAPEVPVAAVPEPASETSAAPEAPVAAVPESPALETPAVAAPESPAVSGSSTAPAPTSGDHPAEKPAALPVPVQAPTLSVVREAQPAQPKSSNGDGLA